MADVSIIDVDGETRDIKDATARELIATNTQSIETNTREIEILNTLITGNLTLATGVTGSATFTKVGRLVIINTAIFITTTPSTGAIVATNAPRPLADIRLVLTLLNTNLAGDFRLNTNGTVTVGQSESPYRSGYWSGSFAYISAS